MPAKKPAVKSRQKTRTNKKNQKQPLSSVFQKLTTKRGLVFVTAFALVGIATLLITHAAECHNGICYGPTDPPSESGQATIYDNGSYGGRGNCAAIHVNHGHTIQVRSNQTGRSINCLVNDSGPWSQGRIVDLNAEDFAAISPSGSTSEGVLDVTVTIPDSPAPPTGGNPAPIAAPRSTRIDTVGTGTDGQLYHTWWNQDGGWSNQWEGLGKPPAGILTGSSPSITAWAAGHLDIVVTGGDKQIWHKYFDHAWSGWESLGGQSNYSPAIASWSIGRLDIVVTGTDNKIYHKWYDGTWNNWESLGGQGTSAPSIAAWGPGRLDLIVRGTNGNTYHKWFDGNWSRFENLGGVIAQGSVPSISSWGNGRLDIFVKGTDSALHHKWFDGKWSDFENRSENLGPGVGSSSLGQNRLDVFLTGSDQHIYHQWFDGGWHRDEVPGGGRLASAPASASW